METKRKFFFVDLAKELHFQSMEFPLNFGFPLFMSFLLALHIMRMFRVSSECFFFSVCAAIEHGALSCRPWYETQKPHNKLNWAPFNEQTRWFSFSWTVIPKCTFSLRKYPLILFQWNENKFAVFAAESNVN